MKQPLFRKARTLVTASALALSLAACWSDEAADTAVQIALGNGEGAYDFALDGNYDDYTEDGWSFDEALPPNTNGPYAYRPAPAWDYEEGGYVDDTPAGEWGRYDEDFADAYYDDTYGDDEYYYDDGADPDQYAWLALAGMIANALGDAPPDYGFYYDDAQPWAWRTNDGYYRYAEPVRGGYRHYYYEPRGTRPFLVRDPLYSYAYRDDRLVVVYDRDGRVLRRERAERRRRAAHAHYDRGGELYEVAQRADRRGVNARRWAERREVIAAESNRWERARRDNPQWNRWRSEHGDATGRRFEDERRARNAASQTFAEWQDAGFHGETPRIDRPLVQRNRAERARGDRDRAEYNRAGRRGRDEAASAGIALARTEQPRRRPQPQADRLRRAWRDDSASDERATDEREAVRVERRARASARDAETTRRERARAESVTAERDSRNGSERGNRDRAERERSNRERAQGERIERERAGRDRTERAERERSASDRADRLNAERERANRETAMRERSERAERGNRERGRLEQADRERAERERQGAERADRARQQAERQQRETAEHDRAERQQRERGGRQAAERAVQQQAQGQQQAEHRHADHQQQAERVDRERRRAEREAARPAEVDAGNSEANREERGRGRRNQRDSASPERHPD